MSEANVGAISVTKDLEIEVVCRGPSVENGMKWAAARLSRVQAQRLAHALLQYSGAEAADPLLGKSMLAVGSAVELADPKRSAPPVYLDKKPMDKREALQSILRSRGYGSGYITKVIR